MDGSNSLYHYGVLGMKWGVRRYRNSYGALTKAGEAQTKKIEREYDGLANVKTLTTKGRQRKARLASEYKELTGKTLSSTRSSMKKPDIIDTDDLVKVKSMTNEELINHNYRKQLEYTYLTNQSRSKKPSSIDISSVQRKKVQDMSNEELSAYNTRKQLENTYASLQPKAEVSRGRKIAEAAFQKVLLPVAVDAGRKYLTSKAHEALGIEDQKKKKSRSTKTIKVVRGK